MTKIQFPEDILHGIESIRILLNNIILNLLDILPHIPDMHRINIAINQPHLIDISSTTLINFLFFITYSYLEGNAQNSLSTPLNQYFTLITCF